MSHSILTAGKDTHIRVVAVSVIAATVVIAVGFSAVSDSGIMTTNFASRGPAVKAAKPTQFTTREVSVIH